MGLRNQLIEIQNKQNLYNDSKASAKRFIKQLRKLFINNINDDNDKKDKITLTINFLKKRGFNDIISNIMIKLPHDTGNSVKWQQISALIDEAIAEEEEEEEEEES